MFPIGDIVPMGPCVEICVHLGLLRVKLSYLRGGYNNCYISLHQFYMIMTTSLHVFLIVMFNERGISIAYPNT